MTRQTAPEGAARLGQGTVYAFAATTEHPRRWLDRDARVDLAARLRFLANVLDGADELTDAADLARDVFARELARLS